MIRQIFLASIAFLISFGSYSQNLIPNSSFESCSFCPDNYSKVAKMFNKNVYGWYSPTGGTPDYFNRCTPYHKVGIPKNANGNSETVSGNAYAGLIVIGPGGGDFCREYLAIQLKDQLMEDQLYCFRFYISWADHSYVSIKQISVYFSSRKVNKWFHKGRRLSYDPQLVFNDFYIENKNEWKILQGIYKAAGGEEYIVFGNFQTMNEEQYKNFEVPLKIEENKSRDIYANPYYYVDDFSLVAISDSSECKCQQKNEKITGMKSGRSIADSFSMDSIKVNEPIILNNIHFKLDKATLLPSSYSELNTLYRLMQKNPAMEIKIAGHTDSTGTEAYNKALSINRAKAVAKYLSDKGIDTSRVSYEGYGNTKPIATDSTKEGRRENRRVEFIIKKK